MLGSMLRFPVPATAASSTVHETVRDRSAGTRETATYIAALVGELAEMADASRMPVLRYLLEMARDEAHTIASTVAAAHSSETLPPE
jgi:hypothetical protein